MTTEQQDVHRDHAAAIATTYSAPVAALPIDPPYRGGWVTQASGNRAAQDQIATRKGV
jgi:hypothetical protein